MGSFASAADCATVLPNGVAEYYHLYVGIDASRRTKSYFGSQEFEKDASAGKISIPALTDLLDIKGLSAREFRESVSGMTDDKWEYHYRKAVERLTLNAAVYESYVKCLRGGTEITLQSVSPKKVEFVVSHWTNHEEKWPKIVKVSTSDSSHVASWDSRLAMVSAPRVITVTRNSPFEEVRLTVGLENSNAALTGVAPALPKTTQVEGEFRELQTRLSELGALGFRATGIFNLPSARFKVTLEFTGIQAENWLDQAPNPETLGLLVREFPGPAWHLFKCGSPFVNSSWYLVRSKSAGVVPTYLAHSD